MVEKNDFTVFRKYEGDRKFYDYNFDMIKDELLKAVEGLIVEDKVIDYIDDIENIVQQMVDELDDTTFKLKGSRQSYEDLQWDYECLKFDYICLESKYETLEKDYDEVYERYCDLIDKAIYGEEEEE